MQVRRPCAVEENRDKGRCVVAYAKAEAVKSAEDRTTRTAIKIRRTPHKIVAATDGVAP